jgi:hypothetical protein
MNIVRNIPVTFKISLVLSGLPGQMNIVESSVEVSESCKCILMPHRRLQPEELPDGKRKAEMLPDGKRLRVSKRVASDE